MFPCLKNLGNTCRMNSLVSFTTKVFPSSSHDTMCWVSGVYGIGAKLSQADVKVTSKIRKRLDIKLEGAQTFSCVTLGEWLMG